MCVGYPADNSNGSSLLSGWLDDGITTAFRPLVYHFQLNGLDRAALPRRYRAVTVEINPRFARAVEIARALNIKTALL